jgi:hypothetical protein
MKTESELPGLAESTVISLEPATGREAPVVWVKALAVHSEWPAQAGTLLREIRSAARVEYLVGGARRSREPVTARAATPPARRRSAACCVTCSTTPTAARKIFASAFKKTFHAAAGLLGEVIVAGQQWLVGRPLKPGFQRFAVKGGSLADAKGEKPLRGGYEDYQAALDAAAFRNVIAAKSVRHEPPA